ncbi:hypothetical protein Taro_047772 [Colocasia esculenta]|uniref:Uncharacterized protein n=1 Tax=Colocasia esculenta TaxID=4460 RepID=A0A843X6Y6_COLES|nr:hypothetical protein [Colocasia esculenta]
MMLGAWACRRRGGFGGVLCRCECMQDKYQIQEQKLKKKTSSKYLSTALQVPVDSQAQGSQISFRTSVPVDSHKSPVDSHTQESISRKTSVLEIGNLSVPVDR